MPCPTSVRTSTSAGYGRDVTTTLLTIVLVGGAMFLMAVGVVFGNKALQGSCGGIGGKDCLCTIEEQRACRAAKRLAAR